MMLLEEGGQGGAPGGRTDERRRWIDVAPADQVMSRDCNLCIRSWGIASPLRCRVPKQNVLFAWDPALCIPFIPLRA
jgi:hypothetical protein